jgi:alpha-mannosidase
VRGSRYPDPAADQGRHTSRITVRPGATIADAVEEGYRTNLPLRRIRGERDVRPLVTITNPAIVVEAVKLAEDRSGDVVVRLYESLGGHAVGELSANFEVAAATFTDLLERPARDTEPSGSTTVSLGLRPFEIVTVRLAQR